MKLVKSSVMKIMKMFLFIGIFLIVGCSNSIEGFQKDADIIRLRHLKYYGQLLEEYVKKTGIFPFQNKGNLPIYVYIANKEQIEFTKDPIPFSHQLKSFKEFVSEIEAGLGRQIDEQFDPQYRPDSKPNFYMYVAKGDNYFFAIHVSQPFPFARKINIDYYKIEISNHPTQQNHAFSPQDLFTNPDFNKELTMPVSKEGFFKEREQKYVHYSKTLN